MRKLTPYHSHEWMLLVETGWLTWTVSDGVALMVYAK
jgi:hypothetical protein